MRGMYSHVSVHVDHEPPVTLSPIAGNQRRQVLNIGEPYSAHHIALYGTLDDLRAFVSDLAAVVGLDTSPHQPKPVRRLYLEPYPNGAA